MNNNLSKVRAACISAVPEIMELKFGCRLKDKSDNEDYLFVDWHFNTCPTVIPVAALGKTPFEDGCSWQDTIFSMGDVSNEKIKNPFGAESTYEILGRPITLEDVLLLLRSITPKVNPLRSNTHPAYVESSVIKRWKLGLPLSEQPPETIDFLASLLP